MYRAVVNRIVAAQNTVYTPCSCYAATIYHLPFRLSFCDRYLVPSTSSRPSLQGKHSKLALVPIILFSPWGLGFRLWRLWDALGNVPGRAAVADDLLSSDSITPSLEDFLSCLRDKSANTAGGPTGLDYRSLQAWPVPMKHKAYEILSGFWSHKTLAS